MYTFNLDLQKEYPFLKISCADWEVRCNKCASTFSLADGGKSDITAHFEVRLAQMRGFGSCFHHFSYPFFFSSATMGDSEQKLAAAEGTWAYHIVQHNQSFRSTDCIQN